MNELPQEELLSAYVDGELNAAERARAEQLLTTDPAARQFVDQLRAVGDRLRELPRQTVGEDLSQRVLRAAERQILGAPVSLDAAGHAPTMSPWRNVARRFLSPRALVWSGAAVAVALLLMVNNPQQDNQRHLAQAPTELETEVTTEPTDESSAPRREVEPREAVGSDADEGARPPSMRAAKDASGAASETTILRAPLRAPQRSDSPTRVGRETPKGAAPRPAMSRGVDVLAEAADKKADVLVVRFQVGSDYAAQEAFRNILAENQIDWEETPATAAPSEVETEAPADAPQELVDDELLAEGPEAVLVEADWDQIEATVAEVAQQTGLFLSVSLEPGGKGELARSLSRFNRAAGEPAEYIGHLTVDLSELAAGRVAEDSDTSQRRRGVAQWMPGRLVRDAVGKQEALQRVVSEQRSHVSGQPRGQQQVLFLFEPVEEAEKGKALPKP